MNYTGTSNPITVYSGIHFVALSGDTLATAIEYSPDAGVTWIPLQEEIGTDISITSASAFHILLPSGQIRFNGGTNVTVTLSKVDS